MKVKFDLKYRQQIESGEYKVETVDGRQVRIVCWDAHNPYRENDIVALATSSSGEGENILRYYSNGHLISNSANVGNKDLIVVIPDDDERIRKIITDSVFYQYGAGAEYKDVLNYLDKLEKQKEQKQNPLIKMLEDKKAITEDIRNGIPTKTIEKERNVKFATPVDVSHAEWSEDNYPKNIETDAVMFCFDNGLDVTPYQAKMIAKHYYKLGFKRIGDGKA